MRGIVGALAGLFLGIAGSANAQSEPVVVVELFTSQGCSSCPPADELLAELADHSSIIPLALHVDYWDYIGWKDKFASPAFTARQKAYARAAGSRTIYTPQMIIEGHDRVEGNRPMEVAEVIQKHLASQTPVRLALTRNGRMVRIEAMANPPREGAYRVWLVRYLPEATVDIERGENAGRRFTYTNIVTSWTQVGEWDGRNPITIEARAEGPQPVVVIVQEKGPAEIVAAAQLR